MIHYLSKFLPIPFFPLGFFACTILISLALRLWGKKWIGRGIFFLGIGQLFFFSSPFVANKLVRSLESKYDPADSLKPASAIVLLSGSEVPALAPRKYPETNLHGDRLMQAARLYRQGLAPRIIITGGKNPFVKDFAGSEANVSYSLLQELWGIDSSAIIIEPLARNTHDHGGRIVHILDSLKVPKSIILVTSALHMPRAMKVFAKTNINVQPGTCDYEADRDFQFNLYQLIPTPSALWLSQAAIHEWYGMLAYKILGWAK